jgi:hypothetical protein
MAVLMRVTPYLNRAILPGETFELPEILFQPVPRGEPALAAPSLHHHLLTGLTAEQRTRVAQAITCFKQWRRFIVGSAGHLLTPPELIDRREGWIGLQLQHPGDDDTSLVFVYRLGPADAPPALRLHGLDTQRHQRPKKGCRFSDGRLA